MLEWCTDHREENSIESVKTSLKQLQQQEKLSTIPDLPWPDVDRRTLLDKDPWKTRARNTWEDYSWEERDAFQLSYINNYLPIAEEIKAQYGIPIAISLAQALVESVGWMSRIWLTCNNDFWLKCKQSEDHNRHRNCKHYDDDDKKNDYFIIFDIPREWRHAYATRLTEIPQSTSWHPKYYEIFNNNKLTLSSICTWLELKKYSSKTGYAQKLITKINTYHLYQYDNLASVEAEFSISIPKQNGSIQYEIKNTNSTIQQAIQDHYWTIVENNEKSTYKWFRSYCNTRFKLALTNLNRKYYTSLTIDNLVTYFIELWYYTKDAPPPWHTPDLTPNDIVCCAYYRLNMNTILIWKNSDTFRTPCQSIYKTEIQKKINELTRKWYAQKVTNTIDWTTWRTIPKQ